MRFIRRREYTLRYNPITFETVGDSVDTIVSITERINLIQTIRPNFVLRLFILIAQFFQHAFNNRPTPYRI